MTYNIGFYLSMPEEHCSTFDDVIILYDREAASEAEALAYARGWADARWCEPDDMQPHHFHIVEGGSDHDSIQ